MPTKYNDSKAEDEESIWKDSDEEEGEVEGEVEGEEGEKEKENPKSKSSKRKSSKHNNSDKDKSDKHNNSDKDKWGGKEIDVEILKAKLEKLSQKNRLNPEEIGRLARKYDNDDIITQLAYYKSK